MREERGYVLTPDAEAGEHTGLWEEMMKALEARAEAELAVNKRRAVRTAGT